MSVKNKGEDNLSRSTSEQKVINNRVKHSSDISTMVDNAATKILRSVVGWHQCCIQEQCMGVG
jgi:hypothetical protein